MRNDTITEFSRALGHILRHVKLVNYDGIPTKNDAIAKECGERLTLALRNYIRVIVWEELAGGKNDDAE